MSKALSEETVNQIKNDYKNGMSVVKIKSKYHIGSNLAYKVIDGEKKEKKTSSIKRERAISLEKMFQRQQYIRELKNNIKLGMTIEIKLKEKRSKKTCGEIVQLTDSVIYLIDNRGFRESITWNSVLCEDVTIKEVVA